MLLASFFFSNILILNNSIAINLERERNDILDEKNEEDDSPVYGYGYNA